LGSDFAHDSALSNSMEGALMAELLVPDDLWELIEPLLPPPKQRRVRYPGRQPLDRRKALTGILFVLKSGIPWEMLPQEMGCGSGMTCWRYLKAWQEQGVWQKIHEVLLARLRAANQIDWSRAVVDSSSVRAVLGGRKRAPIPRIAPGPAANITSSRMPKASRSRPS
jgi:transposase